MDKKIFFYLERWVKNFFLFGKMVFFLFGKIGKKIFFYLEECYFFYQGDFVFLLLYVRSKVVEMFGVKDLYGYEFKINYEFLYICSRVVI